MFNPNNTSDSTPLARALKAAHLMKNGGQPNEPISALGFHQAALTFAKSAMAAGETVETSYARLIKESSPQLLSLLEAHEIALQPNYIKRIDLAEVVLACEKSLHEFVVSTSELGEALGDTYLRHDRDRLPDFVTRIELLETARQAFNDS